MYIGKTLKIIKESSYKMKPRSSILPEKHYSLNISEDISSICEPLFKSHGIKHFTYFRCYDDGSAYTLISHRDVYSHHMNSEYIVAPNINDNLLDQKFHYFAMPELEDGFSQAVYDYNSLFSIKYPIYLFERYENYFDLFIYSHVSNNSSSINFFLNNMNILENFKFYFKDKAKKLINESQKNKIFLPNHMKPNFGGMRNILSKEKSETIIPKRFLIAGNNGETYLSARELDTIQHLANGYTAKQTGKEAGLSPRTIESYLENIKHKLGVHKKSDIIKLVSNSGLLR